MPVIMTYNKYTNHKFIFFIVFLSLAYVAQGAIPSGYYYYARGKKKAELKTILHQISAPITELDYGSGPGFTWQGFYKTDQNADGTVKDMYSDSVRSFSGYSSVKDMAIEHSFPKSWWGAYENMAYKDLFHLYPADAYTNGIKNNLPLGEVTGTPMLDNGKSKIGKNGFGTAYTDNSFEPADEYKGDFARSYLYISTIYENLAPLWNSPMLTNTVYPVWKPWAIDLLLKWSRQDPVSSKELDRNDSIYTIQGNRNPFIDFPDMAEYIWGNKKGTPWSLTSGIDELKVEFTLSPNPAKDVLNISTDEPSISCSVFNLNGQLLLQQTLNNSEVLSVATLNNGMYLLQVQSGSRKTIQKFIINK